MKKRAKNQRSTARAAKSRATKKTSATKSRASTQARLRPDIKRLTRRWFEQLWNQRDASVLQELLDPAAVGETEGGLVSGRDEFRQKLHEPLMGAFPDFRVTVDGILADGNEAAVRWTFEATHAGDTLGIPASNRRVKVTGMSWLKYKNGRLVAGWDRWNSDGLMAFLREGRSCATVSAAKEA